MIGLWACFLFFADGGDQTWRTVLAAILCFAGAGLGAFLTWKPDRWIVALDQTPWKEIALDLAALGLLMVRGWDLGRQIARLVVLLAAVALFPSPASWSPRGCGAAPCWSSRALRSCSGG